MITCNHCGRPNPVNAASCQNCGSPLMNDMSGGASQQQSELPAWLETLRLGERPGPSSASSSGTEASNFIADELIDEDMLPSWMRPDRREMTDSAHLESYPPRRPAASSAPNTDNAFSPARGMDASSLIDQQSLPSWLQEKLVARQEQENISAASLVQSGSLPEWIKNTQPQAPAPGGARQMVQPPVPPQGIMGNDLIDSQELPRWMSAQDTPSAPRSQTGLSTSSLLDANALPAWLRQADKETQAGNSQALPPAAQAASGFASSMPQSAYYYPSPGRGAAAGYNQSAGPQRPAGTEANSRANISASSFIEMDSLPGWLRSGDEQRQPEASLGPQVGQQSFANPPRQAAYGAPVRPVPSRPRGAMPAQEESEVAANVFASMLGVASAAPSFPGQQIRDASVRPQDPAASPYAQPNVEQPQGNNVAGMPNLGISGVTGTPNYMGVPFQQGNTQAAGAASPGNMPPVMPQQAAGMAAQAPQAKDNGSGQAKSQAKPAKRGFLSTILDWFSR